jgi:transposase-like protein
LIAVTDGLKGMGEAIEAVYPATTRQTCLVHLLRQSLDLANWKEREPLAAHSLSDKTRGHFPNDDAATKLIWLALRNITAEWRRPAHHWRAAMNQFASWYEDRFTKAMI